MISGFIDSVKTSIQERSISPLFGSFLISWCGWNYRFLAALISDLPFKDKLSFIDTVLFASWQDYLLRGFAYPLATTLFIIFVYPYPARWTFQFWRARQRELRMIRQKIDDETPLTLEESRELRKRMLELKTQHADELRTRDSEIESLRHLPQSQTTKEIAPPIEPEKPRDEIPDECIKILGLIAKNGGKMSNDSIFQSLSNLPQVKTQHFLDILTNRKLIDADYSSTARGWITRLTTSGRTMVVELKLI